MKQKRLLCIVLSFVLCAVLLAPAAAASDEYDPYTPVITLQPNGEMKAISLNEPIILSVHAQAENEGTLSYAWYDADWAPDSEEEPIATGQHLNLPVTKDLIRKHLRAGYLIGIKLCVVVTNTYVDEDGSTKTAYAKSNTFSYMTVNSLGEGMLDFFFVFIRNLKGNPFAWIANIVVFPLLLILSPFALALYPFVNYIINTGYQMGI